MKEVDDRAAELIGDLTNENLAPVTGAVLEKDILLTEVVAAIVKANESFGFTVIFCGGTCLAKAYGILNRMSEDVDFKLFPPASRSTTSAAKLRSQLSDVKQALKNVLLSIGYGADDVSVSARNNNRNLSFEIRYASKFPRVVSLRPSILLECNYAVLQTDPVVRQVGRLIDQWLSEPTLQPFEVACISLPEALSEKLIAFPRRYGLHRRNPDSDMDPALVRHLYDVFQFNSAHPKITGDSELLRELLAHNIQKDAKDFRSQHRQFFEDPVRELLWAMDEVAKDSSIKDSYDAFLEDMVYSPLDERPVFNDALQTFRITLERALQEI